jgi:hypothetical protein
MSITVQLKLSDEDRQWMEAQHMLTQDALNSIQAALNDAKTRDAQIKSQVAALQEQVTQLRNGQLSPEQEGTVNAIVNTINNLDAMTSPTPAG